MCRPSSRTPHPLLSHRTQSNLAQDSNLLTGVIPSMGAMDQLQVFSLRNNGLSGPFPADWFSTTTLRVYDIAYNSVNGEPEPLALQVHKHWLRLLA